MTSPPISKDGRISKTCSGLTEIEVFIVQAQVLLFYEIVYIQFAFLVTSRINRFFRYRYPTFYFMFEAGVGK